MPVGVQQKLSQVEEQALYQTLRDIAKKESKSNRELTTGATVGPVRTKEFPVDAVFPTPTKVAFVVNVRLLEHPGQPIIRDVLVANQARQLVADAAQDSSTPVLLRRDKVSGQYTVVGRALHSTPVGHRRDYYVVDDVDGFNLDYIYGLEKTTFGSLSATVQTGLNDYRATVLGLAPLVGGDTLFIDPVIYVHGENYFPGYIDPLNNHRFGAFGSLVCSQTSVLVPWTDPRWVWAGPPVGYGAGVISWGLTDQVTVCI